MKNFLATLSIVTLMGSAGIVGAPVAHAAAASPASFLVSGFSCLFAGLPPAASTTVTGAVGDTFTVAFLTMGGFCDTKTIVGSAGVATPATGTINTTTPVTFTIAGTGSFTFTGAVYATLTINVVATGGAAGAGAAAVASPPVPDKLQAVPRPSTGCATLVSDASMNWAGIAGTGWGTSWAQWMNNGVGGDVCVRMLGYNMNTSSWFVR
ncbi:MAG: hypothetical protein WCK04_01675 [Actinomycetes bacterium]